MSQAHLSEKRLQALHDGEPGLRRELEHLAWCPVCQEAFDDTRWTMLLMRLRGAEAAVEPHPDRDELLAFQTGSLNTARQASIREHLAGCRRCSIEYARSRARRKQVSYSSPSRKVVQATLAQFRPRRLGRLGRLLVQRVGGGLALRFLKSSDPTLAAYLGDRIDEVGIVGRAAALPHPASASRRMLRMIADRRESERYLLDACEELRDFSLPSDALIETPAWTLRVESAPDVSEDSLKFTLTSADEERSAAEVGIRIVDKRGHESSAETDPEGVAVLPCPPGHSRLTVELDPPLSVEIRFDD